MKTGRWGDGRGTHREEQEDGGDGRFAHDEFPGVLGTLVLVASLNDETGDPFLGLCRIVEEARLQIVHVEKDNGEKDDIGDDQEDDHDAAPLKGNDATNTAICLTGRERLVGARALGIRGQGRGRALARRRRGAVG